jgi:hypothetical protein
MTTFADHRLWQDAYRARAGELVLYVKFQADVVTEFRVMTFKRSRGEREGRRTCGDDDVARESP